MAPQHGETELHAIGGDHRTQATGGGVEHGEAEDVQDADDVAERRDRRFQRRGARHQRNADRLDEIVIIN